ncbi:hypothetical protein DSL72_001633 [Monilinia vaccinii-corymbosi]|uniref:Uncharacterized protein n=1 Tax=Monilinia vaccinii-corymbosi TaxID=61207 RepID=A0A8A3P690_9HELO|nr:hypothetical protein DSL72_001633 [Monilinia vaccinii-corymbosi]
MDGDHSGPEGASSYAKIDIKQRIAQGKLKATEKRAAEIAARKADQGAAFARPSPTPFISNDQLQPSPLLPSSATQNECLERAKSPEALSKEIDGAGDFKLQESIMRMILKCPGAKEIAESFSILNDVQSDKEEDHGGRHGHKENGRTGHIEISGANENETTAVGNILQLANDISAKYLALARASGSCNPPYNQIPSIRNGSLCNNFPKDFSFEAFNNLVDSSIVREDSSDLDSPIPIDLNGQKLARSSVPKDEKNLLAQETMSRAESSGSEEDKYADLTNKIPIHHNCDRCGKLIVLPKGFVVPNSRMDLQSLPAQEESLSELSPEAPPGSVLKHFGQSSTPAQVEENKLGKMTAGTDRSNIIDKDIEDTIVIDNRAWHDSASPGLVANQTKIDGQSRPRKRKAEKIEGEAFYPFPIGPKRRCGRPSLYYSETPSGSSPTGSTHVSTLVSTPMKNQSSQDTSNPKKRGRPFGSKSRSKSEEVWQRTGLMGQLGSSQPNRPTGQHQSARKAREITQSLLNAELDSMQDVTFESESPIQTPTLQEPKFSRRTSYMIQSPGTTNIRGLSARNTAPRQNSSFKCEPPKGSEVQRGNGSMAIATPESVLASSSSGGTVPAVPKVDERYNQSPRISNLDFSADQELQRSIEEQEIRNANRPLPLAITSNESGSTFAKVVDSIVGPKTDTIRGISEGSGLSNVIRRMSDGTQDQEGNSVARELITDQDKSHRQPQISPDQISNADPPRASSALQPSPMFTTTTSLIPAPSHSNAPEPRPLPPPPHQYRSRPKKHCAIPTLGSGLSTPALHHSSSIIHPRRSSPPNIDGTGSSTRPLLPTVSESHSLPLAAPYHRQRHPETAAYPTPPLLSVVTESHALPTSPRSRNSLSASGDSNCVTDLRAGSLNEQSSNSNQKFSSTSVISDSTNERRDELRSHGEQSSSDEQGLSLIDRGRYDVVRRYMEEKYRTT